MSEFEKIDFKIDFIYNNFRKNINVILSNQRIGDLQEKILDIIGISHYSVEYIRIKFNEDGKNYEKIIGIDIRYDEYVINVIKNKINILFEVVDRIRDENGNVIKNNIALDTYLRYIQERDDEDYARHLNTRYSRNNDIYNNILNILTTELTTINNANNETENNETENNETENNETENNEIENDETENDETENDDASGVIMENNNQPVVTPYSVNMSINPELGNNLNNYIISVLETNLQTAIPSITSNVLNNNVRINPHINTIFQNLINQNILQEDIKIVLTEEEFSRIECGEFENLRENNVDYCCPISLTKIDKNDVVCKLSCSHIFLKENIKEWLITESNKCPVCRHVVAKGMPINL